MAISGSLEDVSVADVMQFIHLGQRTGTLMLRSEDLRAMIGFHQGRLVSAGSPSTPRLGELLINSSLITPDQLQEAVALQKSEEERRTLGQILLSTHAIGQEDLGRVVRQQIEETIGELVCWERGTFEFVVDDLRPVDDIALYPGDVLPDADINTQMVLLEAARIFDERNRDAESATEETHPAIPGAEGRGTGRGSGPGGEGAQEETWPGIEHGRAADESDAEAAALAAEQEQGAHRLQIVTSDAVLAEALDHALPPGFAAIESVGLDSAGKAFPGHEPPIVLLDLREDHVSVEDLARLRRTRVGTPVVALVDWDGPLGKVYQAGALAAVPPEVDAIVTCVAGLATNRGRSALQPERLAHATAEQTGAGVERLRRVFGDLRSGLISATVALNLMHIISESVERAILFLVKKDELSALGAFGLDAEGQPLAERTRGMKLSLRDDNALSRSFERSEVVATDFDEAGLPETFARMLGRPANGKVVIFPVLGAQRVISIIYTDNGENESPIEDIEILELATAQVGMAFENELLRRQINQQS
ncbi:MAG: DUF4388 domain-containing protein [Acidobacteriota bacterium]|jgi:hypothetical protein